MRGQPKEAGDLLWGSLLWATPSAPLRPTLQIDKPQPDQQLGRLEPSTPLPQIARPLQVEPHPFAVQLALGSVPWPTSGGRSHAPKNRALLEWSRGPAAPRETGLVCLWISTGCLFPSHRKASAARRCHFREFPRLKQLRYCLKSVSVSFVPRCSWNRETHILN